MCLRYILPLCLGLSVAAPLHALPEGSYSGSGEGQDLQLQTAGGAVRISVDTRNCFGSGEGVLRQVGETTWHAILDDRSVDETCIVQIDDMGGFYSMQEVRGCIAYHGFSCGFAGTLAK